MAKNISLWVISAVVVALILGGFLVYAFTPEKVRVETKTETEIVEVPVEVTKEVIKEVPVERDFKKLVTEKLVADLKENSDYRECDNDVYRASEVAVFKVYDGFIVNNDNKGDLSITNIEVRLNFDDGECFETLTCQLNSDEQLSCS